MEDIVDEEKFGKAIERLELVGKMFEQSESRENERLILKNLREAKALLELDVDDVPNDLSQEELHEWLESYAEESREKF